MSTDLALRPEERAVQGIELAEQIFTPERRALIAKFLNITPEDPALVPYLSVCASYGLNPVMGQIWLIPQRVKIRVVDGDATRDSWEDRYRPAVGRDGYLAIARRDARWGGLRANVVCERDTFEVVDDGSLEAPKIMHRFASKPVAFEPGEPPHRWRGRVLGAWAKTWVKGEGSTFFYAPIHEFMRMRERWEGKGEGRHRVLDENNRPVLEPDGAWGYVSTMILKAAQSYVLRIAYGITGTVPGDEIAGLGAIDGMASESSSDVQEFDWNALAERVGGDASETLERLQHAVVRVNELAPMSWPPAKLEMVLTGLDESQLVDRAVAIEREIAALEGAEARRAASAAESAAEDAGEGDAAAGSGEPEPEVTEAQVVTDEGEDESADDLPAEAVSEPKRAEKIAALRKRAESLEARLGECAPDSEEFSALSAELDQVNSELEAAENPSQDTLDV